MKPIKRLFKWFLGLFLIGLAVKLWYECLSNSHKRFISNFLEQLPELPGRYSL